MEVAIKKKQKESCIKHVHSEERIEHLKIMCKKSWKMCISIFPSTPENLISIRLPTSPCECKGKGSSPRKFKKNKKNTIRLEKVSSYFKNVSISRNFEKKLNQNYT